MKNAWLASWPKCGNTMTRILLEHHFAIPCIGDTNKYMRETVPIETPYRTDILFEKTHEFKHPPWTDLPALLVVRDPRDAWVSWAHHNLKLRGFSGTVLSEFERYTTGKIRTKSYMHQFYETWMARHAPTAVVRYEDLVTASDPCEVLSKALEQIGLGSPVVNSNPPPSFEKLHELNPKFFRRGIIGAHKDEMPPEIQRVVEEKEAWVMERFGYI